MEKREPKVYYSAGREEKKAIVVFDAGHSGGDIHIYEHKESRSIKEIEEEMKSHLRVDKLSTEAKRSIVNMWVEREFGHSIS